MGRKRLLSGEDIVNGFGFFSSKYLEPGRNIEIEVVLEWRDPDLNIKWVSLKEKAKIKWVGINQSAKLVDYDVGCEFTEPADENRAKLAEILQQGCSPDFGSCV